MLPNSWPDQPPDVTEHIPATDAVIHLAPPDVRTGLMPCYGDTPFYYRHDRITTDPRLVTCSPPARPVRSALANAFWAGVAIAIVLAAFGCVLGLIFVAAQVSGT